MKITVHYLNGSTYTLKGDDYWWTTYQGEFYQHNQKEFLDIYRGRERIHAENLADVLAVEQVYEDGRIILSPFKKCCVIKTTVATKKWWDRWCDARRAVAEGMWRVIYDSRSWCKGSSKVWLKFDGKS